MGDSAWEEDDYSPQPDFGNDFSSKSSGDGWNDNKQISSERNFGGRQGGSERNFGDRQGGRGRGRGRFSSRDNFDSGYEGERNIQFNSRSNFDSGYEGERNGQFNSRNNRNSGRGGGARGGSSFRQNNEENDGWETSNDRGWNDNSEQDHNRSDRYSSNQDFRGRGRGGRGGGSSFRSNFQDSSGFEEDKDGGWNDSRSGRDNNWGDNDSNSGGGFNSRGREFSGRGRGRGRGRGGGGNFDDGGSEQNQGDQQANEKPKERYIPPEPTNDENLIFGSSISSGINFDSYDSIQVKVSGENVIKPISTFEDCELRSLLLSNIKKCKYYKPTPVQKHALPIICAGRDLMACAQTGSGKTAAFLLPILNRLLISSAEANAGRPVEPQVVICSPTRELAIQIYNEARKFAHGSSLKICIAYGGTDSFHQSRNISRGCNIIVATPGRLNDFVSKNIISFSNVQYLVLDEGDRMLDMGFLPAIEKMLHHETMPQIGERNTLLFSATFPEEIQRLATNYLQDYLFLAVGIIGGACSDVNQIFYEVKKFDKRQKLVEIISEKKASENNLTLVFVEKKRTVDFIAAYLSDNHHPTTSIHGDRLQSQREEALSDFKSGRRPILVGTAVAARGLDIKNITHVINYDLPKTIEEYVHRIGRTGRVGNSGMATSFFDPDEDNSLASDLVKILTQTNQTIPEFLDSVCHSDPYDFGGKGQAFGGMDVRGEGLQSTFGGNEVLEEEEQWT